jgi:hypothetical protein
MFPSVLHQALRQYQPLCRLNIWTHQSLSLELAQLLDQRFDAPKLEGPFALDALCSSRLRTPCVNHMMTKNSAQREEWLHFTETFLLIFSAPNLILHLSFQHQTHQVRDLTRLKKQWQERFLEGRANVLSLYHLFN